MNIRKRISLLILVVAAGLLSACRSNPRVTIGTKDQVRYEGTATEQDALALGNALKTLKVFSDQGATVILSKGGEGTVISWLVKDGMWDDDTYVARVEQVTRGLGPTVGGLPVKMRLVTTALVTKKELVVHAPVLVGTKDEIIYSGDATEQDAKTLGKALQAAGYLEDSGANVLFSKGKDGTVLSFVVDESVWDDASRVEALQEMVRVVAPEIGGLPVKVRLVSGMLELKKEFSVT